MKNSIHRLQSTQKLLLLLTVALIVPFALAITVINVRGGNLKFSFGPINIEYKEPSYLTENTSSISTLETSQLNPKLTQSQKLETSEISNKESPLNENIDFLKPIIIAGILALGSWILPTILRQKVKR